MIEPNRAEPSSHLQHARAGSVPFLTLAEVALALDSSHRSTVGEHLGDVGPIRRVLGQSEQHRDVALPGLGDQLIDRRVVELDEVTVGSCEIERPGERHLGEDRQVTAVGPCLVEDLDVAGEVGVEVALLTDDGRKGEAHRPMMPPTSQPRYWRDG